MEGFLKGFFIVVIVCLLGVMAAELVTFAGK